MLQACCCKLSGATWVVQASLTGESEPIHKELHGDPFCKSGTEVRQSVVFLRVASSTGEGFLAKLFHVRTQVRQSAVLLECLSAWD